MATVVRTKHLLGRRQGLTTLEQRFRFGGEGANAAAVASVLLTAPLIGGDSVFGERPGEEGPRTDSSRTLGGFSPAPGFRFDVTLAQQEMGVFLVRFSQPDRKVPYLQGEVVWIIADEGDGAAFDEQINTESAFQVANEPLRGPGPSLRRWLFFQVGHKNVMNRATNRIAVLINRQAP